MFKKIKLKEFRECSHCHALIRIEYLQVISEEFSRKYNNKKYYCMDHRKPYDRAEYGGMGISNRFYKEVLVDIEGKIL